MCFSSAESSARHVVCILRPYSNLIQTRQQEEHVFAVPRAISHILRARTSLFSRLDFSAAELALSKVSASLRLNVLVFVSFLLNLCGSWNFSFLISFICSSAEVSLARLIWPPVSLSSSLKGGHELIVDGFNSGQVRHFVFGKLW